MNIRLNFVNSTQLSSTASVPSIVLFQKQADANGQVAAVAWKVIERCRPSYFHPFLFADDVSVSSGDTCGNYSKLLAATGGSVFALDVNSHGQRRLRAERSEDDTGDTVSIANCCEHTAFHACLFVRGQLVAKRRALGPGERADFTLDHTLWVAVARRNRDQDLIGPRLPGTLRELREGDDINQTTIEGATPIDLEGVASANIVMHGDANGLMFRREAVVWA